MLPLSTRIFQTFLDAVVLTHAFGDAERARGSFPLPDKTAKDITAGKRIDDRIPYLMTVSGKGGYVPGSAFEERKAYRNISLLDHMVSVARGAAVFAELDLRAAGVCEIDLSKRIAILIAVGFLHDADKILNLPRSVRLTTADVADLSDRYGIANFLNMQGVAISSTDLLSMINAVEMTRADFLEPGMRLLTVTEKADIGYVRLADRLEGLFLDSRIDLDAMTAEIEAFGGFRTDALKRGWRKIHLSAPHTPFLLSNLQLGLSAAIKTAHGMPPLIEVHHDGELLMIFPEENADSVLSDAIDDAVKPFRLGMRIEINPRGSRDILEGAGDVRDLLDVLSQAPLDCSKALFVHVDHLQGAGSLRSEMDSLTRDCGFLPDYGGLATFMNGKHYQPWPFRAEEDPQITDIRHRAAVIVIAMGCTEPKDRGLAKRVPDAIAREKELIACLERNGHSVPAWIAGVSKLSRQTLLAVFAAVACAQSPETADEIFDRDGLIDLWLLGNENGRSGLAEKIGDTGHMLSRAARQWLTALLQGTYIEGDEDLAEGRCHFTNMPVSKAGRIDSKSGLEGLNVSAFSGREGRPESFTSAKSQTLVSPIAFAEHRLRTILGTGLKIEGIPAFISMPTMMGLFASLNLKDDQEFLRINQFDLMRLEVKKGKRAYPLADTYGQRVLFSRHYTMPEKQREILEQMRMMMRSALRFGRPVHIFRGLPTPQNAFFHIDMVPAAVRKAIGGNSLRLEQIEPAIETLGMMEQIADINGCGLELAMGFADPETRFQAACEILVIINRQPDDTKKKLADLRCKLQDLTQDKETQMSETENVILDYARAMAKIQEAPRYDASNTTRTLGMRIALEAIEGCKNEVHQGGRDSMIAAIAGQMRKEFEGSGRTKWIGKDYGNPFPVQKAFEAATLFVDRVWVEAFAKKDPASKARRVAMAIYQVGFENECRLNSEARKTANAASTTETTFSETLV